MASPSSPRLFYSPSKVRELSKRRLVSSESAPGSPLSKRTRQHFRTASLELTLSGLDGAFVEQMEGDAPYKPCQEEAEKYYYGLAGEPRLVARTSTQRWTKRWTSWGQTRKRYGPIQEGDDIAKKWSKKITLDIVQILQGDGCPWSFAVPVKIGLEREPLHNTLLIGVTETGLEWEKGIKTATECLKVLRSATINDIQVELCELSYSPLAASVDIDHHIDSAAWKDDLRRITNKAALPLTSSVGYPISYASTRETEGTLGLHMRLGDDPTTTAVYGLTCRHVVCDDRLPDEAYRPGVRLIQPHVHASQSTFEERLRQLRDRQKVLDGWIEPLQTKQSRDIEWYSTDPSLSHPNITEQEQQNLNTWQSVAKYNRKVLEVCEAVSNKSSRLIGYLAYHPAMALSTRSLGYLTDWALVALDLDKFPGGPANKVFLGLEYSGYFRPENVENHYLQLHLPTTDTTHERIGGLVATRGCRSGFKFGRRSAIEAVIRRPGSGLQCLAWEMLVVPEEEVGFFSQPGDSGSAVFDTNGEVIGILTASAHNSSSFDWRGAPGRRSQCDISFVAPIGWVLDDIEHFTGLKACLA